MEKLSREQKYQQMRTMLNEKQWRQYFDVLARGFAAQPPPAQDETPKRRGR